MPRLKHKLLFIGIVAMIIGFISVPSLALADNCSNTLSGKAVDQTKVQKCLNTNPIVTKVIDPIVNFLSAGVGLVVVATIIAGGIQYSTAGGSPDAVTKAKDRLMNGVLALVFYLLIFGFLQWIIPGGLFNS
jgi:hypothetical protein